MQNLTELPANSSSGSSPSMIIKVCVVIPFFSVFLACVALMLHTFASHREFLESSRYILFAYMLANDTLQLLTSVLLFLFAMAGLQFAIVFCAPLLFICVTTFQNTPLILATMSLERYVAILHPLQRPAAWSPDRIWVIILALWIINCVLPLLDFSMFRPHPSMDVLSTPVLCKDVTLNSSPIQVMFRSFRNLLGFAVVAVVILFTYVRILRETRKMRQDKASVSRALQTVLLHAFQLLLCTLAFTHPVTESLIVLHAEWLPEDISFFNYFCFVLIPRFLSPIIYGLRDQSLRRRLNKTLCGSNKQQGDMFRC